MSDAHSIFNSLVFSVCVGNHRRGNINASIFIFILVDGNTLFPVPLIPT